MCFVQTHRKVSLNVAVSLKNHFVRSSRNPDQISPRTPVLLRVAMPQISPRSKRQRRWAPRPSLQDVSPTTSRSIPRIAGGLLAPHPLGGELGTFAVTCKPPILHSHLFSPMVTRLPLPHCPLHYSSLPLPSLLSRFFFSLTYHLQPDAITAMDSDARRRSVKVVRVLCDGCERASAVSYCSECSETACNTCVEQLHVRGRRQSKRAPARSCKGRTLKDLQKAVGVLALCKMCRTRPAYVSINTNRRPHASTTRTRPRSLTQSPSDSTCTSSLFVCV